MEHLADRNWEYLVDLLPADWRELAAQSGAVRRLRGTATMDSLLRTLLLHIGHGCSLRTTAVLAKAAGWAQMSDVALLKKLRVCEGWLQAMCAGLLRESGLTMPATAGKLRLRLIDGTLIHEPGQTGSSWRVHYSFQVPGWQCDRFVLTPTSGRGNGETLRHFAVKHGDCLIADRGFSHLAGIEHVQQRGGHVIVRLSEQNTPLEAADGQPLALDPWLERLAVPGQVDGLRAWLPAARPQDRIAVRVCAVRKSIEAAELARRKLRRRAQRKGQALREVTLRHSDWVMVLTTLPDALASAPEILECYRVRWQVELAFKRLKSLADAGHLPKHDPASSRAWLYGKLLLALLTEKMQRHAAALSPWGGRWLDQDPPQEPLA